MLETIDSGAFVPVWNRRQGSAYYGGGVAGGTDEPHRRFPDEAKLEDPAARVPARRRNRKQGRPKRSAITAEQGVELAFMDEAVGADGWPPRNVKRSRSVIHRRPQESELPQAHRGRRHRYMLLKPGVDGASAGGRRGEGEPASGDDDYDRYEGPGSRHPPPTRHRGDAAAGWRSAPALGKGDSGAVRAAPRSCWGWDASVPGRELRGSPFQRRCSAPLVEEEELEDGGRDAEDEEGGALASRSGSLQQSDSTTSHHNGREMDDAAAAAASGRPFEAPRLGSSMDEQWWMHWHSGGNGRDLQRRALHRSGSGRPQRLQRGEAGKAMGRGGRGKPLAALRQLGEAVAEVSEDCSTGSSSSGHSHALRQTEGQEGTSGPVRGHGRRQHSVQPLSEAKLDAYGMPLDALESSREHHAPGVCQPPSSASSDHEGRVQVSTKKLKQIVQLLDGELLSPGERVVYLSRTGKVLARGCITLQGIRCDRCTRIIGCTEFERCAGSSLRRPCEHIFTLQRQSFQELLQIANGREFQGGMRHKSAPGSRQHP